jgi:hypothetical protein
MNDGAMEQIDPMAHGMVLETFCLRFVNICDFGTYGFIYH